MDNENMAKAAEETEAGKDPVEDKKDEKSGKKSKSDDKLNSLQEELDGQKEKFLRLFAEFDNFKKRTAKERIDLAKIAGQEIIKDLLSILDDFERAEKAAEKDQDTESIKKGFLLIKEKLFRTLQSKGLEAMESKGENFDPDLHEAITEIPAPSKELEGKVVDVVEKGYKLNDKIIRYAKVVVGK